MAYLPESINETIQKLQCHRKAMRQKRWDAYKDSPYYVKDDEDSGIAWSQLKSDEKTVLRHFLDQWTDKKTIEYCEGK